MRNLTSSGLGLLGCALLVSACVDDNYLGGSAGASSGTGGKDQQMGPGGADSSGGRIAFQSGGTDQGAGGDDGGPNLEEPSIIDGPIKNIDLLFVVDNSVGMLEQQRLFQEAVPHFLADLTNPPCLTSGGNEVLREDGQCPTGSEPSLPEVDLHVGVISSSLGGHGSNNCADPEKDMDDHGRLMPSVRPNLGQVGDPEGTGFVSWDPTKNESQDDFLAAVDAQLRSVGQQGCGYEAPLEAFYRFLADPSPLERIEVSDEDQRAYPKGTDTVVLEQREAFLRRDGILAVVVLSNEDDCSALDGGKHYTNAGFGYLTTATQITGNTFGMPEATPMCEQNPNDRCCFSCLQAASPPEGCEEEALACDGTARHLPQEDDHPNLRCFDQKRRFGVDLLYPTDRYSNALTQWKIRDARYNKMAYNPLMVDPKDETRSRDPSRVFFAGIVGVPWQDLATEDRLNEPEALEYLDAANLAEANVATDSGMVSRWELMLGRPGVADFLEACEGDAPGCGEAPVAPFDPFMVPSVAPRPEGTPHPLESDSIASVDESDPQASVINGHEVDHSIRVNGSVNDSLQFACTYPLATPRQCSQNDASCECADGLSRNLATCQPPEGGEAGTIKYYDGAYPAPRILTVMSQLGSNAVPASACPKVRLEEIEDPDHGYNPALRALSRRITSKVWRSYE